MGGRAAAEACRPVYRGFLLAYNLVSESVSVRQAVDPSCVCPAVQFFDNDLNHPTNTLTITHARRGTVVYSQAC